MTCQMHKIYTPNILAWVPSLLSPDIHSSLGGSTRSAMPAGLHRAQYSCDRRERTDGVWRMRSSVWRIRSAYAGKIQDGRGGDPTQPQV